MTGGEPQQSVSPDEWDNSPLIGFIPSRDKWGIRGDPDYFDNITLEVDSGKINLDSIEVVLNGMHILNWGNLTITSQGTALGGLIMIYRLSYVGAPYPNVILKAALDIGQTASYKYSSVWPTQHDAYEPLPRAWCSEYACNIIKEYSEIRENLEDWIEWECDDIDVHTMWDYYSYTDTNGDGCPDRISAARSSWLPWEPYGGEPERCIDEWSELGDKVKRGYYVGLRDPRDPNRVHSTFFIRWIHFNPNECTATFEAIGGNQGGAPGRVTVTKFTICNDVDCDCEKEHPDIVHWWTNSNDTTFFGKTWHPSKE